MALSPLAVSLIVRASKLSQQLLEQIKPVVDEMNIIYDAEGGLKTGDNAITQNNLDNYATGFGGGNAPTLSGLTKAQLDDAMYVLTNGLKTVIDNGTTALAALAARAPQLPG